MNRLRLWSAGVVAFMLGMPLTEQAFAGDGVAGATVDFIAAMIGLSSGDS